MHLNEIITVQILAAAGHVHWQTVLRWRREGRLPDYDVNLGLSRGWKLSTIRRVDPAWAELVETYLAQPATPPEVAGEAEVAP